jgi:hypothetical protein
MTVTTPARFTCFGLTVGSELPLAPLDPLPPGGPGADVTVRRGPVPASLGAGETGGGWLRAAPGRILLDVPAVGRILIRDGREIVVDAAAGVSDRTAGLWVLGSGMSALLHQRGLLVLHASAVAGPGGAAALLGRSGAGKSTTAGALGALGWQILTDDICVVVPGGDGPGILAGYPYLKLWPDAAAQLGRDGEGLDRLAGQLGKLAAPVPPAATGPPVPLRRLYVLDPDGDGELTLIPLPGRERLGALAEHTNRREMVSAMGMDRAHFEAVAALAAAVPVTRVTRPATGCPPATLARRLTEDLGR